MAQITITQPADIPAWLDLAREVEPLFGPMVDEPGFHQALQKNIARGTAFCIREAARPAGAHWLEACFSHPSHQFIPLDG